MGSGVTKGSANPLYKGEGDQSKGTFSPIFRYFSKNRPIRQQNVPYPGQL